MKQAGLQDQKIHKLGGATGSPHMFPTESGDKGRGRYRKQAKRLNKKH